MRRFLGWSSFALGLLWLIWTFAISDLLPPQPAWVWGLEVAWAMVLLAIGLQLAMKPGRVHVAVPVFLVVSIVMWLRPVVAFFSP